MSTIDTLVITETSPTAAAGITAGTAKPGCSCYEAVMLVAELVGATGGTLDVLVQHSEDGVKWLDLIRFDQLAGSAAAVVYHKVLPAPGDGLISTIGEGAHALVAGMAAGALGGFLLSNVRLLMIPGAGTTVGAALTLTIFGKQKTRVS